MNLNSKDDGCTCRRDVEIYAKQSYPRTAGVPLACTDDQEQNGALCYPKCSHGYYGEINYMKNSSLSFLLIFVISNRYWTCMF